VGPSSTALPELLVISLQRAHDRREFVHRMWGDLGVEPSILDAVDGATLTDDDLRRCSPWRAAYHLGRVLTNGEVAVAMSHLAAYRWMLERGLDEVVVLEDDVRASPDFLRVLSERDRLPADWDVVTLHSLFDWAAPTPIPGVLSAPYSLCTFERNPMGTQAYLLRARAATQLLEVAYPIRFPADELVFRPDPAGLAVYGVDPSPVVHDEFPSELHAYVSVPSHSGPRELGYAAMGLAGRAGRRLRRRGNGVRP